MNPPYPYDPALHELVELQITRYFRRALREKRIVTYRHRVFGVWVVALFDGEVLVDIGRLGTGEGEGPWCSSKNAAYIVQRMKTTISPVEAAKQLKQWYRNWWANFNARMLRNEETLKRVYSDIRGRHGARTNAADAWARRAAPELVGSGKVRMDRM